MSILLSGDTHRDYDLKKLFPENLRKAVGPALNHVTHLIVLGDWGAIWGDSPESIAEERRTLEFYDQMPWETLVITGNHEGYDRIERLPWTTRYGAPARRVTDKIHILQHGNVYTVAGQRLFVFGGGESLDRDRRVEGDSWWPQEIPTQQDLERGIASLQAVGGQVDYVLTHTCPRPMADHLVTVAPNEYKVGTWTGKGLDVTVTMLTRLEALLKPHKGWYFGHYHVDHDWQNYHCQYHKVAVIGEETP